MMEEIKNFISSEKNLAEEFLGEIKTDDIIILCGGGGMHYIGTAGSFLIKI